MVPEANHPGEPDHGFPDRHRPLLGCGRVDLEPRGEEGPEVGRRRSAEVARRSGTQGEPHLGRVSTLGQDVLNEQELEDLPPEVGLGVDVQRLLNEASPDLEVAGVHVEGPEVREGLVPARVLLEQPLHQRDRALILAQLRVGHREVIDQLGPDLAARDPSRPIRHAPAIVRIAMPQELARDHLEDAREALPLHQARVTIPKTRGDRRRVNRPCHQQSTAK